MSSDNADLLKITYNNTLGALFVGFSVSCLVYGIVIAQTTSYFSRYPSDKLFYKAIVAALLTLETVDQMFIGHFVYFYTITNFNNPLALLLGTTTWSLILQLTLGAFAGVLVKICFAMRVWRFSRHNIWITGIILLATLGQFALAIAYTIKSFALRSVYEVSQLRVLGTIALGVGVFTDILIAASLCYFLRSFRTGHRESDTLVNTLSRYAINTGALTGAVSLSTVILYNVMPDNNFIFIGLYFVLSKLYSVSFLATLNTRRIIRGRGTDQSHALSSITALASTGGAGRESRMPSAYRDWDSSLSHAPKQGTHVHALSMPSSAYLAFLEPQPQVAFALA